MLRSVQLICGNLLATRATVRLPDRVPPPADYRGEVILDPDHCVACGMCAYVCVSNAITGSEQQDAYVWTFQPGQCTFCSRCVERCSGQALSMKPDTMRIYTRPGELFVEHRVAFPKCRDCGVTVRPAADRLAHLAFEFTTDETRELLALCERCKRKRLQRNVLASTPQAAEEKR